MSQNKKTKQIYAGIFAIILASGFLFGCEQVQSMFQPSLASSKSAAPALKQEAEHQVQGTVLAKVNGDVITLESFEEKIKALEALDSGIKIKSSDEKKGFLNDLITQELVVQEARGRGIDKKKEVRDAIDDFRNSVFARQLIMDETKGITVEPSEIEAFYKQYKKEFAAPEELRAKEIVASSEATAKEILIALLQGGDFAALAKERSISGSASKGGDLGFVKPGDKFENFDKVVWSLDQGQVSPIFKGPDGFYIVKIEDKKGGVVPAMSEVYDQIKAGLLQQKQAERIKGLTDKLKSDAKIEIKEDLLR